MPFFSNGCRGRAGVDLAEVAVGDSCVVGPLGHAHRRLQLLLGLPQPLKQAVRSAGARRRPRPRVRRRADTRAAASPGDPRRWGQLSWNAVRPAAIRDEEAARHAVPHQTFAWVHVDDLVALAADAATGRGATSTDPATGPVAGACTPVNVAAGPATFRDYYETVTAPSASRRSGTTSRRGPAGCSPTAPRLGLEPCGRLPGGARRARQGAVVTASRPSGRRRRRPSGRCALALRPTGARALTGAAGRRRRRERARADAGLAST